MWRNFIVVSVFVGALGCSGGGGGDSTGPGGNNGGNSNPTQTGYYLIGLAACK
jgi:hypothetical protein